jgi:dTDP-4-dehydrorhamnose reductase
MPGTRPEVWAGLECARVRVNGRVVDQLELTGHDKRISDLDRLTWLGVRAVRYPALWERVAPRGLRNADWRWTDERLAGLREAGIKPIVGLLHHGSGPGGMSLSHPGFVRAFARYGEAVARRYPWVDTYVPINEPLTTARFAGLYGFWSPHARSKVTFARLLVTQCLAIREAMAAIRAVRSDARLLANEDVGQSFGTPELQSLTDFVNERRWLTWDLLMGAVVPGHAMWRSLALTSGLIADLDDLAERPCPPDSLGVDHYVTSDRFLDHRVTRYPMDVRPPLGEAAHVDVEAVRVAGIPDAGFATAITATWQRYHRPIVLAEVALAGESADQVAWWQDAWAATDRAREAGARVDAVACWAVVGATGWADLLRGGAGYEPGCFDVSADPVLARPLALAVRQSAAGRSITPGGDVLPPRLVGWWHAKDRFLYSVNDGSPERAA